MPANENVRNRDKSMPSWVKTTLRILRKLLVPFLCIAALFAGLIVGYVYMGGESAADVWKWSTWKHLFDLVFAN